MNQYKLDFFFDFETRSELDLSKSGAVNYATHRSTEATLLTWCFGRTGAVKVWRYGDPIPPDLLDVALFPEKYNIVAHNVLFDYLIWTVVFKRQAIDLIKNPRVEDLSDNMALTCHFRVGGSLDNAAKTLGLPYSKDKEGRRIMLKQCKPNAKGEFVELTSEEWEKFEYYGVVDTKLLREVYYMCPQLPAQERYAWEWTFRRNLQGIRYDVELVEEMHDILMTEKPKLVQKFEQLTGGIKINSVKAKDWFKPYYPWIENMQADTIRDMLQDQRPEIPWQARYALELKDLAGSTSLAKIEKAPMIGHGGRIYELLAYHYAQTKRWAGRGIQIQNFPRPDFKKADSIKFDMNVPNLAEILKSRRPDLQDPLGFIKNLLRRIWIPDPGQTFYCGDWSKIEPTVLFWLVGLGPIPKNWYEQMAATIYSVSPDEILKDSVERQLGKSTNLGCGYGMGYVKFRDDAYKKEGLTIDLELSKKAVYAYRNKYWQVVQFWEHLESGMKRAVLGETSSLCGGKVHIMPMQHNFRGKPGVTNVEIRLPSGGRLYYHDVRVDQDGISYNDGGMRKHLYGGLLCEHVTSATAREILVPAIWRLEKEGFDVLGTVHDELWAQAGPGRDQEYERLMCINPSWCPDMRITAESDNGVRYLK